jgi:hypothetical protein
LLLIVLESPEELGGKGKSGSGYLNRGSAAKSCIYTGGECSEKKVDGSLPLPSKEKSEGISKRSSDIIDPFPGTNPGSSALLLSIPVARVP